MVVERGHEQDVGAEEMLKGLKDGSPCDLLVVNDDLGRLEAYLTHWGDQHQRESTVQDGQETAPIPMPTPLLMLTTVNKEKKAQAMVDAYLKTWKESTTPLDKPVRVVIMSKPTGPLKLMHSLRDCFSDSTCRIKGGNSTTSNKSGLDQGFQSSFKFPPMSATPGPTVGGHFGVGIGFFDMAYPPEGLVPRRKEEDNRYEEEEEEKDGFAATMKPDAQKQELELGSLLVEHRCPLPTPTILAKRKSSFIGESLQTPPQPTPPQPHLDQQVQQQEHGHGYGQGQEQEQSVVRQKARRSIRNFMGSGHLNGSSRGGNRKIGAGASLATGMESLSLSSSTAAMSGQQALVRDSVIAAAAPVNNPSNSTCNNDSSFPWSNLRVLIVEDNVTNRMILRTFFKKNGVVTVVEAENGQIGVDRFEEELVRQGPGGRAAFDFVLMDLQMPVMDGNLATKRIREAEERMIKSLEGKYCPSMIFALTGLAAEEDKRLAFECGVDGYLTKPVSLKGLSNLLTTCRPPPPPPSPPCLL